MAITPFLSYVAEAEAAARLYADVFPDSKIISMTPGPDGTVFSVVMELMGQTVYMMNGGEHFEFSDAFSLMVNCTGQTEVDRYWDALIADGGKPGKCGWLTDRFGLSWQIIPSQLSVALSNPDPVKAQRAMTAMLGMSKIIVAELEASVA